MYKFKLAPLLRHRKRQEDEKMREMSVINRKMVINTELLHKLTEGRESELDKFTQASGTAHNVALLRVYQDFLAGRDSDILHKKMELRQVGELLEKKRSELAEYVKRRRVLEILRDRQEEEYNLEAERREQKELDDISNQLFLREAW
ncbi:MAG: flagellar export protein FliJ [Nitrospinota bacterium]|nr:flagellar export protein FliJ [Nitrospinota bacterium]